MNQLFVWWILILRRFYGLHKIDSVRQTMIYAGKYDWNKIFVALALQWKHKKNCVVTKCRRSCCRNIVFEQLFSFVVPPLRIEGQKHACYIKISTLLYSCVFMETKMFWICIKSLFCYQTISMNICRTNRMKS